MSYKSPMSQTMEWERVIETEPERKLHEALDKHAKEIAKQYDDYVVTEVRTKLGVDIDVDELVKALRYDRDQYNQGYKDGAKLDIGAWEKLKGIALELLDKYEEAELMLICETVSDIAKAEAAIDKEVEEYRRRIEELE